MRLILGANVINKFYLNISTLCWNKAVKLIKNNHVTCNIQSEQSFSAYSSYATMLKIFMTSVQVIGTKVRESDNNLPEGRAECRPETCSWRDELSNRSRWPKDIYAAINNKRDQMLELKVAQVFLIIAQNVTSLV